jgi:signal peptidase
MRLRRARDAPDEDESEEEEDEGPSRRPHPRRGRPGRAPVRSWDSTDDPDEEEAEEGRGGLFRRSHDRVYFRARDSFYFEPLVALAIIVLLLVSLYAFTQNWPPVYVVESSSMQHGTTDQVGLINTGDLVLAQKVSADQVTPYVVGAQNGYSTYGEYGDVLLYNPFGQTGIPIIHRALIFLIANPAGGFDAPSLAGLSCGPGVGTIYDSSSSPNGCGTVGLTGVLTLHHVGWQSANVAIPLNSVGSQSGFVTMGDNNLATGSDPPSGISDQAASISTLVQPGWMVGVARGMVPWFGSVKLLLQGSAQEVPAQSWEFLGLTLVALVLVAMGLHYVLRAEGIEDPRRKAEEEEEDEEEEEEEPAAPDHRRNWLHPIRSWRERDDEDDEGSSGSTSKGGSSAKETGAHRGRPRPSVGRRSVRPSRGKHRKGNDPDDDL